MITLTIFLSQEEESKEYARNVRNCLFKELLIAGGEISAKKILLEMGCRELVKVQKIWVDYWVDVVLYFG